MDNDKTNNSQEKRGSLVEVVDVVVRDICLCCGKKLRSTDQGCRLVVLLRVRVRGSLCSSCTHEYRGSWRCQAKVERRSVARATKIQNDLGLGSS